MVLLRYFPMKKSKTIARLFALWVSFYLALPAGVYPGSADLARPELSRKTLRTPNPVDAGLEEDIAAHLRENSPAAGMEESWAESLGAWRKRLNVVSSLGAVVLDFNDTIAADQRPHPGALEQIRLLRQAGLTIIIVTGRHYPSIEKSGFLDAFPLTERKHLQFITDGWSVHVTFDHSGKPVETPLVPLLENEIRGKIVELISLAVKEEGLSLESIQTKRARSVSFRLEGNQWEDKERVAQRLRQLFGKEPSLPKGLQAYVSSVAVDVTRQDKAEAVREVLRSLDVYSSEVVVGGDSGMPLGNDRGLVTRLGAAAAFLVGPSVDALPPGRGIQFPNGGPAATALALQIVVERVRQLNQTGMEEGGWGVPLAYTATVQDFVEAYQDQAHLIREGDAGVVVFAPSLFHVYSDSTLLTPIQRQIAGSPLEKVSFDVQADLREQERAASDFQIPGIILADAGLEEPTLPDNVALRVVLLYRQEAEALKPTAWIVLAINRNLTVQQVLSMKLRLEFFTDQQGNVRAAIFMSA